MFIGSHINMQYECHNACMLDGTYMYYFNTIIMGCNIRFTITIHENLYNNSTCLHISIAKAHMISVKVSDKDLGDASRFDGAPHQLYLTTFTTVKHPATKICTHQNNRGQEGWSIHRVFHDLAIQSTYCRYD